MSNELPVNGAHKAEEIGNPLFSGPLYDKLKFIAQVVLPALATFYITVGQLWGWPEPEKVSGTIMAVDFLLGVILGISSNQFKAIAKANKVIEESTTQAIITSNSVDPDTGIPTIGLTITAPLAEVLSSDTVRAKIENNLPPEHRIPG